MLFASWRLNTAPRFAVMNLPRAAEIRLDSTVLGFGIGLSILTVALVGLFPSMQASRPDLT